MTGKVAHADFETRSAAPLKQCGISAYAEHASTEVLCLCYCFDDGPVKTWIRGQPAPADLIEHVRAGGLFVGHNVYFELAIWNMLHKRAPHIWPPLSVSQCRCTMIGARMLAVPGALDKAGEILGIAHQKDKAGHRLMMRLCKPNKAGQWVGEDDDFIKLAAYCADDVRAERDLDKILPTLPPSERPIWELDHKINDRGVQIDLKSVDRLIELVENEAKRLKLKTAEITGGRVTSPARVAVMLEFLETEGVKTDNLKKGTVDKLLKGIIDSDTARELLEIRKMFAKASTAKLKAMRKGVCEDERIRDLLAYLGADTWRWAGRRVQTQNLVRLPKGFNVEEALEWVHSQEAEALLSGWFGSILEVVSWLLRPMIIAAPGMKLMGGDFANIEGRVLAWAAGEEWKLEAFRAYDAGLGPDMYRLTYARSFKIAIELVDEIMRQIGKVEELALGYQGALNAFRSMAVNYGITVIADHEPRPDTGAVLTESEVIAIVEAWRDAHPATCGVRSDFRDGRKGPRKGGLWNNLFDSALKAVLNPGVIYEVGPVCYRAYGDFLKCRLPSGRTLSYPFPSAEFKPNKWGKEQWIIETWGTDSKKGGKRWQSREPYGGLLAENITQAIARDLLAFAMPRLEAAGYPVVMHVHDEIICEVPEDFGDVKEFAALMCELPAWAKGLPVTVGKPWQGKRYLK